MQFVLVKIVIKFMVPKAAVRVIECKAWDSNMIAKSLLSFLIFHLSPMPSLTLPTGFLHL